MDSIIHHTHNSRTLRKERRFKWIKTVLAYVDGAAAVALGMLFVGELYVIAELVAK